MNKKKKKIGIWKSVFIIYSLIIAKLVFFRQGSVHKLMNWSLDNVYNKLSTANFIPFDTIKLYMRAKYPIISAINLIGNVVVFIPLGILIPNISKKKNFFSTFFKSLAFILLIEISQLIGTVGEFDVDDIILNIAGAVIGYILYSVFSKKDKNKKRA